MRKVYAQRPSLQRCVDYQSTKRSDIFDADALRQRVQALRQSERGDLLEQLLGALTVSRSLSHYAHWTDSDATAAADLAREALEQYQADKRAAKLRRSWGRQREREEAEREADAVAAAERSAAELAGERAVRDDQLDSKRQKRQAADAAVADAADAAIAKAAKKTAPRTPAPAVAAARAPAVRLAREPRQGVPELVAGQVIAKTAEVSLLVPAQLSLPLDSIADARLVQHVEEGGWRGYATLNRRALDQQMREWRFPVSQMPWVIDQALQAYRGTHDLYIAQHSYTTAQRSTATLLSLNIGHIDLDVYKSTWAGQSESALLSALLKRLDDSQIPHPSYVVDSGRGLQLKWLWTSPLSPGVMPRWQAAHRHLVSLLQEFGADPKAILPTQIMRLVGSQHRTSGRDVRVAWVDGGDLTAPKLHSFDAWCDAVLPFTRAEVAEFRKRLAQYDQWRAENAANATRLADDQAARMRSSARRQDWTQVAQSLGVPPERLAAMDDLVAGEIWQRRLATMSRLQELRGYTTVPEGQRHAWTWMAANAMGWVNRGQARPLKADVVAWAQRFVPTYRPEEALSAAAAVLARATQQPGFGSGLYRMTEPRFRTELGITGGEIAQLQQLAAKKRQRPEWDEGVMGFEPMKGLSYDEYRAETARRQAEAATRTNTMHRAAREPLVAKAKALRTAGQSLPEIAKALGVSVGTAWNWTKA